jgi:hypothetical protein
MRQGLHRSGLFDLVTEVIKNLVSEAIIPMVLCKKLVCKRRGFFFILRQKPPSRNATHPVYKAYRRHPWDFALFLGKIPLLPLETQPTKFKFSEHACNSE